MAVPPAFPYQGFGTAPVKGRYADVDMVFWGGKWWTPEDLETEKARLRWTYPQICKGE